MKIYQVYKKYQTPENLQKHLLQVASFAMILLDHWIGSAIDNEAIIKACTIHDIAKPITFDLAKQASYGMTKEAIEKLGQLQQELKAKYGDNEHQVAIGICKELGCNEEIVRLVDNLEWKYLPRLLKEHNNASLITVYCDMRISPKGIIPLHERITELKKRSITEEYYSNAENEQMLEYIIKTNTSVNIHAITDEQLQQNFDNLLSLEL